MNESIARRFIKLIVLSFLFLIAFTSCRTSYEKEYYNKKTWVWVELEVKTKNDTFDYHYYGQINQSILDRISMKENYDDLFMLSDIRYYNDADKLKIYKDESDLGTMFFRTRDIVKIELINKDPLYDKKYRKDIDSLEERN